MNKKIAIVYNSSYYLYISRLNLIKNLQNKGYKIFVIAPRDDYSDKLIEKGIIYIPITMKNDGTNPFEDLKLLLAFYKIYKKVRPDVVLHFTIKPNIYGSFVANKLNIPVINNITGLGTIFLHDNFIQKLTVVLYKLSFRNVEKIFFQNIYDKNLFISKKIIKSKQSEILPGSGIDINKFSPMIIDKNNDNFVFLLIARVIRDKGIIEYVEAAKIIKKKYKNVEFRLLGQLGVANKTSIPSDEVNNWEKAGFINYLGVRKDVRKEIAMADCIVLPSYREGTSRTLLEAASMAKPIIATDVPGCNNIVEDEINGYLCKVKDANDLAEKMEKMIKLSAETRNKMGAKGRKKMINEFNENIVINKYLTAIDTILTKRYKYE